MWLTDEYATIFFRSSCAIAQSAPYTMLIAPSTPMNIAHLFAMSGNSGAGLLTIEATGVTPEYVRLSVGLEDVRDILADLEQALRHVPAESPEAAELKKQIGELQWELVTAKAERDDFRFSAEPLDISEEEAAEELHRLFVQAVVRQTVSDVPVGSYLSGGMDSGSITAIASAPTALGSSWSRPA